MSYKSSHTVYPVFSFILSPLHKYLEFWQQEQSWALPSQISWASFFCPKE